MVHAGNTECIASNFAKSLTRFESREDITRNVTAQLGMIPQEAIQICFQQWQDRRNKCVHYQGDYFEGN
jgi:hypothetical protein